MKKAVKEVLSILYSHKWLSKFFESLNSVVYMQVGA